MYAWIGLGANLQKPVTQLKDAIKRLSLLADIEILEVSSFYRTPPWGDENQDDFINAVIAINTCFQPLALLQQTQKIENDMGRVRKDRRWGPRLIDIDILLYEQQRINSEELTVPHPHMHERAFVLLPLAELNTELVIPGKGRVDELLGSVSLQGIARIKEASVN